MSKEEMKHTALTVKEKSVITLNGVSNIESFDSSYVTLETSEGTVCIEGRGMKIESLSREGGEIQITGRIDGVFYAKEKKAKGGLSKMFG